jgi:hypothetical protein
MAKGRKSSVRYYETKGAYITHFEGKQIRLADVPQRCPQPVDAGTSGRIHGTLSAALCSYNTSTY